ncbi:MAG: sigma-70 family RNA polymerase sigma factor [Actinomycetia bacterium]|nr:sigma-70 family RNA polymerase sigma factor [Actinomycetes bacterium]MCP4224969.1 sigma-70 family RNA polymerase sigma factor [Actinomycetes bacterium]MCP5033355.1 sigma-70 family RNA polymerase sigma factor [Actinomycetes bacterium]
MTALTLVADRAGAWPRSSNERTELLVAVPEPEFERFFLRHYDHLVRSLTVAIGDEETARDCVQEAFVKAAARWKKVRRFDNPVAWVRRVAINRSRDLHRADQRRRRREERVTPVDASETEDASPFVDGSLRLVELLEELPAMQRSAAALFYIDDLSVNEIASDLGISSGAVKFHLNRARGTLRGVLEREGQHHGW